jgi:hypothetical protein
MSDRGGKGTLAQIAILYERMAEQAERRDGPIKNQAQIRKSPVALHADAPKRTEFAARGSATMGLPAVAGR